VSATTNSRGLTLPRVAQELALDRFMTFLSQPRAARVVILAALRASAVPPSAGRHSPFGPLGTASRPVNRRDLIASATNLA
jgi:hypothetical protein